MGLGIGVVFHVRTYLGLCLFILSCCLATMASSISLKRLGRGIRPFVWLFVFTALLHLFMTPGDPLPGLPYATKQGFQHGLIVGMQLTCAIWISTLMTLTTSPLDMVWAMEWYLRPLKYVKIPIGEIALLVMLAIRFIPLLFEESDRIQKAQKSRGIDIESGGLILRVKALLPVLIPLLQGMLRRADDLAVALTLRGYTPGMPRSQYKSIEIAPHDLITLVVCIAVWLTFLWV
jgi:energy-coupling factor transport system permease protein